jgi:hypothetical protein
MNTYDLPAPAALTTSVNDREAVRACESFLTYGEFTHAPRPVVAKYPCASSTLLPFFEGVDRRCRQQRLAALGRRGRYRTSGEWHERCPGESDPRASGVSAVFP